MKIFTPAFVLMAFATSQATAAPAAEAGGLEARAKYCVDVKVCHGYNYGGGCYKECKRPGHVYPIKKEYMGNIGSFKIGTKGYDCELGPRPGHGANGAFDVMYPGSKKLSDEWINNFKEYQCNKLK